MKQQIDVQQYLELSTEARKKLFVWGAENYIDDIHVDDSSGDLIEFFLPTIGQMIEYLEEHTKEVEHFSIRMGRAQSDGFSFPRGTLITHIEGVGIEIEDEPILCDALWQSVKEHLETD